MPSRSDVEQIQAANNRIVTLAERDLDAFWATLDLSRPEAARDAMLEFLPQLIAQYGEVAATVASDWYEELRYQANVAGVFRPPLVGLVPDVSVQSQVRFAAAALFTDTPATMLEFLKVATSKYVLQPGRDTITKSAKADPGKPRYARVPSGAETCAFCLMLASRGAVYESKSSAGGRMHKYHGKCDCVPTPLWEDSALPKGYDPDAMYQTYLNARNKAESTSTTDILAQLRDDTGRS